MKTSFYHTPISQFLKNSSNSILETVLEEFKKNSNNTQDITKQLNAWKSSISYFQNVLNFVNCKDLEVVLEYNLPFSGERIDAILLGKSKEQKLTAIVIEFKGWTFATYESETYVKCDLGKSTHPNYQLSSYLGKLTYSHSASDVYDFHGLVCMYNMENSKHDLQFDNAIILRNEEIKFADFINKHFSYKANTEEIDLFLNGSYAHNKKLFNVIQENADALINSTYNALAVVGFGLSKEQIELISEIETDVLSGNSSNYLIQGAPGSGKTLVAVNLLLSGLKREVRTVLALRNNRLIACLRNVFDSVKDKYGKIIKTGSVIRFYSTGKSDNPGIAENNFDFENDNSQLVIFDEAQRMDSENIRNSFIKNRVNVIFFDEFQRLNYIEKGKKENFEKIALRQNVTLKKVSLKGIYRVEGGELYHNWIENFIQDPSYNNSSKWNSQYELKFFKEFDLLYDNLKDLKEKNVNFKVALIASFTEVPIGIRIGPDLKSNISNYKNSRNNITWLIEPSEYVQFWVEGKCNDLKMCSSIYGCQGFEADYVGFVWGRDFVIRDGKWELGESCEDYPKAVGKYPLRDLFFLAQGRNPEFKSPVMLLLKNRLRIFLSRGIKGTYIYCEDKETREYLLKNYAIN